MIEFFDCNVSYGVDIADQSLQPVHCIDELKREMERSGVKKAVVYRVEQYTADHALGNKLLAEDIAGRDGLFGVWTVTPPHTHELPEPSDLLDQMKKNKIIGWKLCPGHLRFLPKAFVLAEWLKMAVEHRIPVFVNTAHGTSLDALADILQEYPELTVVLTDGNVWPNDRMLRPFVAQFPNVYLDLTYCITSGGIESFVKEYGASRLLYGSGFPYSYFGANMLMIQHADISKEEKEAIAGGNMNRIIREMVL